MLKTLELTNFQTHHHLIIDFDSNVTTIIGPSDEGKSAIKRAIEWVCLNQPAGNDFMNWDEGINNVSVALTTDLGTVIRSWNKGENLYILKYPNKEPKEYKAFGRTVPEPIEQFLQMSDINFQGQHDQPFWFCNTAGEVSRNLNKIVNLDLIDVTLAKLDSQKRATETLFEDSAKRIERAKDEYMGLSYVEKLNADMITLKQKAAISIATRKKHDKLYEIEKALVDNTLKIKRLNKILSDSKPIIKLGNKYNKQNLEITKLESHTHKINELLPLADMTPPDTNKLRQHWQIKKETEQKINKLGRVLIDINAIIFIAKENKSIIEKLNKELKELTKGLCPICQTPLKS